MAAELIVASEAEDDIAAAYAWYEAQRIGLGEEFLSRVDACIQGILRSPEGHKTVYANYRRVGAAVSVLHLLRVWRRCGHSLLRLPHVARP